MIFFSYFDCQRAFPYEGFQVKKYGVISEKKPEAFDAELNQPPVVVLQQAIFYNIFSLYLWLRIIRTSNKDV